MAQNVCFLFGINGVGKSTLAHSLAEMLPGARTINASETLRAAIGVADRETLERMDPKVKFMTLRRSLVNAFLEHSHAPLIICDSHLVVSVRDRDGCHKELMWHEDFESFTKMCIYVTAPLEAIRQRRERDIARTGRQRSLCLTTIADDERINRSTFYALFSRRPFARVIENRDRP